MSGAWRRISRTCELMLFSLLPKGAEAAQAVKSDGVRECLPQEVRGGLDRLLDEKGELRVFFPECLGIAAPFLLFRLKRQGFSRCSVQVSERGLYVEARR